ncbi:TVP38/TMEM64 family protein [Lactobacillus acetotolerans]|mgnify:CR=1 FL=1|uniref:TVP38/TMEM64 family protein n=1 Tax=Lactobacillus acetotolerans TaxID=1600 RepID=A0A0D6A4C4_9LACO|nr:VTT domain-containing protein [Lactobacillus acetotolerans]QFG51573.1 TVP38/TMEM64 family protein [Lactobacillus acetotolerans]QGV04317.1 TVP38/TMEM64 family protein [Lactobacillus acetotolerans]BAQ57589.1 conserved hypothetical protein [Lactobacillus acetotolerans]GGV13302.1 hypothetical protein GCM10011628_08490 [Lactobacillus acetotolerans DSM 20749 = JCM 3825]
MKNNSLLKILFSTVCIIIGLLVLYKLYLNYLPEIRLLIHFDHHNERLLLRMVRKHGTQDLVFLFLLNIICVAIPFLSNGIFCVLNGALFGPEIGMAVNWVSDVLGQILVMTLLTKIYNPKKLQHSKIYNLLMGQDYPQAGLTVGYSLPFIPSATVSYANLLINKRKKKRLIPVAIGSIPLAYLYAYGGDSILHLDKDKLIKACVGILLIAIISLTFLLVMRRVKKHKKGV